MTQKVYKGLKVNFLTVIDEKRFHKNGDYRQGYYLCKCECGNVKYIKDHSIITGRIRDCGCGEYMRTRYIGKSFGYLQVINAYRERHSGKVNIMLVCRCVCGKEKIYKSSDLINKNITSCGCKTSRKKSAHKKTSHKKEQDKNTLRIMRIYRGMFSRCYNEKDKDFKNYGARGVDICEEWKSSKTAFQEWSLANGYANNLTIDRIDNNKGYSPENCHWVTIKQQQRNKRNNVKYEVDGRLLTVPEIAEIINMNVRTLSSRLRSGMNIYNAICKPVRYRKKNE